MKMKTEAVNHALDLSDPKRADELRELSVMLGYYNSDPGLQHWHVLQRAENDPQKYLELVKDPTRKAKYLIQNGLNGDNPILRRKGFMILWEDVHLGNSFDDAVQKILLDEQLLKGIEAAMNRAGA
jgi:hypothetical protein